MADLGRLMAAMALEDENKNTRCGLTDMQVVTRLKDALASMSEETVFKEGDVLIHKFPDLSNTRNANRPHIFLEYIKPLRLWERAIPENAFSGSAANVLDMRVMCLSDSGETVVHFLMSSKEWKLHPDFT